MAHNRKLSGTAVSRFGWRLFACVMLSAVALQAQAEDCSEFPNGVLDGDTGAQAPSQIQIDRNCTIRNFPADNPLDTNFSFLTQPGQTDERWVVIFDNVVHTGEMACNSVAGHKIWFTNGSSTSIQEGCQNYLIPVEKIDKLAANGQTTAAIGVPFTYRLTMPVLFDPATGVVINTQGSVNDLHGVTVTDDLNATGADLTYLGHTAYWLDSGAPVPHTFSNVGGVLTFDNFPIIPAGDQIIVEITVVLDDTPGNTPGTQFVNTAKWDFGRLIDGEYFEPLPGEWGIAPPMTIAGPELVMTKTGPATMNLGETGDFTLDIRNTGNGDAWDLTVRDRLPNGPNGGMCDAAPAITGIQVFEADGVTPVPGKGPLTEGLDYSLSFSPAPACELTLDFLTPQATIGAGERLIVNYATSLDVDTDNGVTLTNVAGVTRYFNGDSSNSERQSFSRPLTNGTVGTDDHQDAHTVTVALSGYFFEKTVANLTSGMNPADTAAPGDRLRYTLRLRTTDSPLSDVTFHDDLGEMNATAVFTPGTLSLVPGSVPPGADTSGTNPNGGTNGAGIIDIGNLSLAADSEISVQFDIDLAAALVDGTFVTNQAELRENNVRIADSDDPNVNGLADPDIDGDEDPTRVVIEAEPPAALRKWTTQATASIGETFRYRVRIPSVPHTAPIYDVRIFDDLNASAADLQFVNVTKISGSGAWVPVNTGSSTSLVIEDPINGIDIPAGEQAVIEITVALLDTGTNVAGLTFTNTATYTYNQLNGDPATERPGLPGTSGPMTVVEPELTLEKTGPLSLRLGIPGNFALDVHNVGGGPAYNLYLADVLPDTPSGGMCDAAPTQIAARLFEADGVTPAGPPLTAGVDYAVTFTGAPDCQLTLQMQTSAAAIGPDERLIVTYQAVLDADTQRNAVLTNVAAATEWFSAAAAGPGGQPRRYVRPLTDGTVGVLDHEDAHTLVEFTAELIFEKTVVNVTTGQNPGTVATPGDTLRYSLRVENTIDTPVNDFSIVDELDRLNAAPAFQPGTLNVITLPAGATASATDPNGGAAGTGLLDVRGLNLAGTGDSILIEFEVVLAPVIANGSYVTNQSELIYLGFPAAQSDDPNVNGPADPNITGDEDPTRVQITSAPDFVIEKTSSYVTGDPNILLAGETLRYTITVRNIGTDNATNVELVDQIPANTSYVAGSTTLNGAAVPDASGGASPLTNGILINAPQDTTPGVMNSGVANNVATIVFDVVVNIDVADGTVISNQAFVSAPGGGVLNQPSDDPRTPTIDDPTRDVVGNLPLLYAEKSAALEVDLGSPGIVDPGDTLRYTITIYNNGNVPATLVELVDTVPDNVSYVQGTTTLNGDAVPDAAGGIFPLEPGLPVSSADLAPPLPAAGEGVLSPGESATVEFLMLVDDALAAGTLIVNQATVSSDELPDLLTDGDGNPATGPEPTVVVVGDAQQLSISKQVTVVGGGTAEAGSTLEYLVTVRNIAAVPATAVVITDDLDVPVAGQLTYVDQSASMNGLASGISIAGSVITADYSATNGALEPGEIIELRFRAVIEPTLAIGTTVTNVAEVFWNDPQQSATASVSVDIGGVPGTGSLNGTAWHDADFDNVLDPGERVLEGWTVELYRNNQLIFTTLTDADGNYRIGAVVPNDLSNDEYEIRFAAPGASASTALLGMAESDFSNDLQRIYAIVIAAGSNLQNLDLPIDPNGVIYNSITRGPVGGAVVTLISGSNGGPLPSSCFDDPAQQDQVTLAAGYYKFDLNFSDPACPSNGSYTIQVTPPAGSYIGGPSAIIPPANDGTGTSFDVPSCPGSTDDAIVTTTEYCEVQLSESAPPTSVAARTAGTNYYLYVSLDDSTVPGSSQIFNNHIPIDPELSGAVAITKTTPAVNVSRGQLVPYLITVSNSIQIPLTDINIVDRYPAGFRYVEGSARVDGVAVEPVVSGRELIWSNLTLDASGQHEIQLLLAVGAGVSEGEFVNRAQVVQAFTGEPLSGEATATVRLVPDPTFDCTDVIGKVYADSNRNGAQDGDEPGLGGVRLVTPRGLAATTDAQGRFHITCAITPNESRGSNFVLKLDDRTLPSGYRLSSRPVQIKRATRGKALRFNFGASIHRVVGLDLADAAFEPDSSELRRLWMPRLDLLLAELKKGPAVLRLSYLADIEDPGLVDRRLKAIERQISAAWEDEDCCYTLEIEPEVHWRLGKPPEKPGIGGGDER